MSSVDITPFVPPIGGSAADRLQWANALPPCVHLGLVCTALEPGHAVLALETSTWPLNPNGAIHGGLVLGLADQALGLAVISALQPGLLPATATLQSEFHRPAFPPLTLEARITRHGRTIVFAEVDVRAADGRTCMKCFASFSVDGSSRSIPESAA